MKKTYSKLSNFNIVDTGSFFFFSCAQTQRGDIATEEIQDAKDEAGADEGVGAAGKGVCELVADLDPVPI